MIQNNIIKNNKKLKESLKADCADCFGLCCVALYFSKVEGFPYDKTEGVPCINLGKNFKCRVHKTLIDKGYKGCKTYDCLGAGQKVSQVTYKNNDWINHPNNSNEMFTVFSIMRKLHEMLWYLSEALRIQKDLYVQKEIIKLINETLELTYLSAKDLKKLDLVIHRHKVNELLLQTSQQIRKIVNRGKEVKLKHGKRFGGRLNFIGANLKNTNLRGQDLSGALLMAADLRNADLTGVDFLGADLRDADLKGANLTNSIYITQEQINSAKGNMNTQLPKTLNYPSYWIK